MLYITEKVQIPHRISELEEMALYQQDQKWLEEVKQVGGKSWRTKMSLEYQNDLQGKKVRDSVEYPKYFLTATSLPRASNIPPYVSDLSRIFKSRFETLRLLL